MEGQIHLEIPPTRLCVLPSAAMLQSIQVKDRQISAPQPAGKIQRTTRKFFLIWFSLSFVIYYDDLLDS